MGRMLMLREDQLSL